MQSQLSAIFNHAVRLYELDKNPVRIAGPIGGESEVKEMQIWTTEEYKKFSEAISDKPQAFYAFEVLYWTGIRLGELLALTAADFDFKNQTMRIDKSLQNIKGKAYVTTPKTVKSNRTVKIPEFLCHDFWRGHKRNLAVIRFIYICNLNKRLTLDYLWKNNIVEPYGGPRPFDIITDEQFEKIINDSKTNLFKAGD